MVCFLTEAATPCRCLYTTK